MTNEIIKELKKLEAELDIKILFAVESGSRAWGFASKDSDWDVRFIYIHNMDWYLSIDTKKDSFDKILPNDIDLSGWELKKALKLFRKSNPPLMEWLRSPIQYYQSYSMIDKLRNLSSEYFNPKSCMHHYLHMAEGNYKTYFKSNEVRVKKYFYVLRPILACSWIENNNTMPPMEFQKLVESQISEPALRLEIDHLLKRKMAGDELDVEPKISIINDFLEQKIDYYNDYLSRHNFVIKPDTNKLNQLFRETLQEIS
ncbi:MAG: nucleotidyltransferase domain-containing protein [Saprospiraceae bacterium]|nr:nucleotidyltransferase domain-containing protein [Saprospiraceae bacterium]